MEIVGYILFIVGSCGWSIHLGEPALKGSLVQKRRPMMMKHFSFTTMKFNRRATVSVTFMLPGNSLSFPSKEHDYNIYSQVKLIDLRPDLIVASYVSQSSYTYRSSHN